jgi:hypothetical protein
MKSQGSDRQLGSSSPVSFKWRGVARKIAGVNDPDMYSVQFKLWLFLKHFYFLKKVVDLIRAKYGNG